MAGKWTAGRAGALALVLAWAALTDAAPVARAAPSVVAVAATIAVAGPASGADDRLLAECADLRAQLDRKTAEISALKRGERGVRQDYDMRQRMAEANELARRLTALESQLQSRPGQGVGTRPAGAAASPEPVEGSAALEARADLLSDEAHKLSARAAGMVRAAGQMRTRAALRRKAANVDRDPFASLDGAKRLMFVRAPGAVVSDSGRKAGTPTSPTESGTAGGASNTSGGTGNPTPTSGPTTLAPPTAPPATPPAQPGSTAPPAATSTPAAAPPPQTPQPAAPQDSSKGSSPAAAAAPAGRSELAAGALIDPALSAELSRMAPSANHTPSEPEALEQAAAALVSRAQLLETQAKALRAKAASR